MSRIAKRLLTLLREARENIAADRDQLIEGMTLVGPDGEPLLDTLDPDDDAVYIAPLTEQLAAIDAAIAEAEAAGL